MNIDQLMESLSENAPDPHLVLASVGRKRHAARQRMYAASGGLAFAAVAVVVSVLLHGLGGGARTLAGSSGTDVPATAPGGNLPLGSGSSSSAASGIGGSSAAACGTARLQAELAQAVRNGASVVVAYGTLTTGPAAVPKAGSGAPAYYSLTLQSVQTLAGPTVTSGSIAWIAGVRPAAGSTASASPGSAAGELFGVVSPSAGPGAPGRVLRAAQVTNGQVVLGGASCLDVTVPEFGLRQGLDTTPRLFGADVVTTRIPLATAEKLAAAAGKAGTK